MALASQKTLTATGLGEPVHVPVDVNVDLCVGVPVHVCVHVHTYACVWAMPVNECKLHAVMKAHKSV